MSKIIDQPVLVEVDRSCAEQEVPKKFFWFKRWVKVMEIIDAGKRAGGGGITIRRRCSSGWFRRKAAYMRFTR